MTLKWESQLEIWRSGRQRSLRSHRDPRQVPLSKPDSAGPGQDRVWRGQAGGSGWGRPLPGDLAAAAAAAPDHRSAASGSLPGPAAGKDGRTVQSLCRTREPHGPPDPRVPLPKLEPRLLECPTLTLQVATGGRSSLPAPAMQMFLATVAGKVRASPPLRHDHTGTFIQTFGSRSSRPTPLRT